MNRELIIQHLSLARRHVEQGRSHIARQKEIIAKLMAEGLDASRARALLTVFKDSQRLHVANRTRLEAELKAATGTRAQRRQQGEAA